ncbi:MAG: type IV toxin-antitoxin system AbiEi family antitoxin domain-containing protein [Verrucomicrobia bacterium]|nr:type IV toxin-antitoxin system AbiEi family antitoxin domain-containing protein [Verrucomicrobiota bacterium]
MASKYTKALQKLSKKNLFSSADGRRAGISSRMLAYFCSKGLIERVCRGVYKVKDFSFTSDFEWEDLALTALSTRKGVICLISALSYYELTDEIMREFWIAVPHSTSTPTRENIHAVRMRNISLGQTTVQIGNQKIKIFDRERTVIDAFRYLDKETALKSLQIYLQKSKTAKPNIDKLLKYAQKLRIDLNPYVEAFTL